MVARRWFSHEFKLEAVQLVKGRGISVAQAARDLGVHENVLRKWIKQLPAETQGGLAGGGLMAMQAELARLRKENAKLRMERDILKKAAAYFAKESM
jgi:transposase